MKCPFCDTEFETETLKAYDEVLQNEQPDDMTWNTDAQNGWQEGETEGMRVYICESCGGEIIAEEVTGATRCPFCDNPVIMSGQFADELRPDCIIPFPLAKQAAKEAFMYRFGCLTRTRKRICAIGRRGFAAGVTRITYIMK